MLQPHLYRLSLLLGLAAAVILMFSVVSRPEPLRSDAATDGFEAGQAANLTRQLLKAAPDRSPGSPGDDAAAAFVAKRFRGIEGGEVSEQLFDGRFDGEDVSLRNVTLVLPGLSSSRLVIAAPRDCAGGQCAVSSGAATGAMLELAEAFGSVRHRKTIVFVSLDGSAAGAAGARQLADSLSAEPAEAAIVLSQPAARVLRRPLVIPWSSGPQSTSIQLIESAKEALGTELGAEGGVKLSTIGSLMRLAVPAGLGDQAPLIESGVSAVGISSVGARPLPEGSDRLADLSVQTLGGVGRSVLSLAYALDGGAGLEHGPDAYVPLAGKLIPGWALALLALALLIPVGVVSIDGLVRSARRGEHWVLALAWVLSRAIPFVAVMLLAYLLAAPGAIPDPAFPFDPARFTPGVRGVAVLALLTAAFAVAVYYLHRLPLPEEGDEPVSAAIGSLIFLSALGIWFANPYLALLLVPTAHLWLFAALPEMRGRLPLAAAAGVAGLVIPLLALVHLGGVLGSGISTPWDLLLMFTGRHFGPLALVPLCLLGACLLALLEVAATRPTPPDLARPDVRMRGPLTYAGPGSLGGTESALPGRSGR
jgi:hypothetical protein